MDKETVRREKLWLAGAAAALASQKSLAPRAVPVKEIQRLLLKQGAYLG